MILNSGYYFEIGLYIASIGFVSLKIYCKLFVFCLCLSYLCYVNQYIKAMKLYVIEVANYQDDTVKANLALSNEPLTKDNDYCKSFAVDGWEYVSRCYVPQISVNTWSEADTDEAVKILFDLSH
jgi:hypothetical protein